VFGSSFQKQVSVHTRIPNTHHCLKLNRPFKKEQLIMKWINSQINQAIKLRCLKIAQTLLSNQEKSYYFTIRGGSRKKIAKKRTPRVPTSKKV
jgi:aspartyl/asparaginyl beta-hydroxylase (cupin superfamily)